MSEQHTPQPGSTIEQQNARTTRKLLIAVVCMFGFAFALVPLYDVLCDVTGLNGRGSNTQAASIEQEIDTSRTVTIEFVADTAPDMPWEFEPQVKRMEVHPGEIAKANFYVKNLSSRAVTGQAIPSISPGRAASYFKKTQCFCFDKQELQAGKDLLMPVIFYVDPDLNPAIKTITLSYQMFNITEQVEVVSNNATTHLSGV